MNIKNKINLNYIYEIVKSEVLLKKKRFLVVIILSLVSFNLQFSFFIYFSLPSDTDLFLLRIFTGMGAIIGFLLNFFVADIFAGELNKKTELEKFSKAGKENFFIGKSLTVFLLVLAFLLPTGVECIIMCLIFYSQIPIILFACLGYYFLVGLAYSSIYLLCSAISRSEFYAMIIGFIIFLIMSISFSLFAHFLNFPYLFLLYAEIAVIGLFYNSWTVHVLIAIVLMLAYIVAFHLLAYIKFKTQKM